MEKSIDFIIESLRGSDKLRLEVTFTSPQGIPISHPLIVQLIFMDLYDPITSMNSPDEDQPVLIVTYNHNINLFDICLQDYQEECDFDLLYPLESISEVSLRKYLLEFSMEKTNAALTVL